MERRPEAANSSPVAVLPGAAIRGGVLGLVFAAFAYLYLVEFWEWTGAFFGPLSSVRMVVALGVAPVTLCLVLALAVLGYSRRRYKLTDDEVVEHRGLLRMKTRALPYDEITDVHLSQSTFQQFFDVGTIRINDQDASETGQNEAMRLRFVTNPNAVYDRLRDEGESRSTPRLSVDPDPLAAVTTSVTRGALAGPLFGFVPTVFLAAALQGQGYSTAQGLLLGVGLVAGAVLIRGAAIFRRYDDRTYEVYEERVEEVGSASTTAVAFDDVDDVLVHDSVGRLGFTGDGVSLLATDTPSHVPEASTETARTRVELIDADGEVLLSIRYISAVDRLCSHLADGMAAAGSAARD
ncbi:PH domain-containing protein [Halovenus salina]|uniref:PH domain-containing protein n=1 Tax=Halovenus salina TaxID=1510225 RepID=A0ABD5VVS4_9EURY|nr:PH domain-containing protein [Halovenus salina]